MKKNLPVFAIAFCSVLAIGKFVGDLNSSDGETSSQWMPYLIYQCQNKQVQLDVAEEKLALLRSLYGENESEIKRNLLISELSAYVGDDAWGLISKTEQERLISEWPSKTEANNVRREAFARQYGEDIEEAEETLTAKKSQVELWKKLPPEERRRICRLEAEKNFEKMSVLERMASIPKDEQYGEYRREKQKAFSDFLLDLETAPSRSKETENIIGGNQ